MVTVLAVFGGVVAVLVALALLGLYVLAVRTLGERIRGIDRELRYGEVVRRRAEAARKLAGAMRCDPRCAVSRWRRGDPDAACPQCDCGRWLLLHTLDGVASKATLNDELGATAEGSEAA